MKIKLLKSKIHRATVTGACLDYEGSISIDTNLMALSGIVPYEKVHVLNVTNGNRLETYAIPSLIKGEICINGAAAHLINKKDIVIIVCYATMKPNEAENFLPIKIYPNEKNEIEK
jgi:aspartate 1-decarboxylase